VTGRPSAYDPEKADGVLDRVAAGATLTAACRAAGVPKGTFLEWKRADRDGLSDRYARARDLQLEHWADEIVDIADDAGRDPRVGADGGLAVDHAQVQRCRLRIDSRKWLLSKLKPERYGEGARLKVDGQVSFSELVTRAAEKRRKAIEARIAEAGSAEREQEQERA
jgi:predicted CopG family antitoxin